MLSFRIKKKAEKHKIKTNILTFKIERKRS